MSVTLAVSAVLAVALTRAAEQPLVRLPTLGAVLGDETLSLWTSRRILRFRGLPYALPPLGSRRFLPPMPMEATAEEGATFDSRHSPRPCPQSKIVEQLQAGNYSGDPEDCLFLNIFTPKIECDENDLLPIMLYISGGGLYEGSAEEFPPGYLLEKDVVLAVPQYRLGAFGFLSLQTDGIPGNVGFLDQLAAVRWVKRNARRFCGDERRLTLVGQSAGALSVALMHRSPLVEPGLFHQAIMQSGSALANWPIDDRAENYAASLADVLRGCSSQDTDCPARLSQPDPEQVLRAASALDIILAVNKLNRALHSVPGQLGFPKGASSAVRQRAGAQKFLLPETILAPVAPERRVPLMIGVTAQEGSFIASGLYDLLSAWGLQDDSRFLTEQFIGKIVQFMGVEDPSGVVEEAIRHQYWSKSLDKENVTFADIASGLIDFSSAVAFKGGAARTASMTSQGGTPTWLYSLRFLGNCSRFGYGGPTAQYPFAGGVAHSNDLLFLFPFYCPPPLPPKDDRVARLMVELWTSFAANGRPTAPGVDWPSVKPETTGPYLQIRPEPCVADDFVKREFHVTSRPGRANSHCRKSKSHKRNRHHG